MYTTLALLIGMNGSVAEAGPPKLLKNLTGALDPSAGEVNRLCKDAVSDVETWVAKNGSLSGDNIKEFTDFSDGPRSQPDDALEACLKVETKSGSGPEETQREMALKLLDLAIAKHLVIDDVGDGRSYYAAGQGYYNDKPFDGNHNACNEMDPNATAAAYRETYLLKKLNAAQEAAEGRHPEISAKIGEKIAEFEAKGKAKSDACLATKLDSIKPFVDAAPASVKSQWEAGAKSHFAKFSDLPILKVVFFEAQWRRTKKQEWSDSQKAYIPVDFKAMDLMVYVDNGEFVDGYYMTVVHDFVQDSEYLTFPYAEGVGRLPDTPHQRVMKKNF